MNRLSINFINYLNKNNRVFKRLQFWLLKGVPCSTHPHVNERQTRRTSNRFRANAQKGSFGPAKQGFLRLAGLPSARANSCLRARSLVGPFLFFTVFVWCRKRRENLSTKKFDLKRTVFCKSGMRFVYYWRSGEGVEGQVARPSTRTNDTEDRLSPVKKPLSFFIFFFLRFPTTTLHPPLDFALQAIFSSTSTNISAKTTHNSRIPTAIISN